MHNLDIPGSVQNASDSMTLPFYPKPFLRVLQPRSETEQQHLLSYSLKKKLGPTPFIELQFTSQDLDHLPSHSWLVFFVRLSLDFALAGNQSGVSLRMSLLL